MHEYAGWPTKDIDRLSIAIILEEMVLVPLKRGSLGMYSIVHLCSRKKKPACLPCGVTPQLGANKGSHGRNF